MKGMAVRNKTPFQFNEIYFITFTIAGWLKIFVDDDRCALVYKWFDYMREKYGNKIHGYVIMPNHIHLLLYIPKKSPELSKLIFNAKRFLAYEIPKYLRDDKDKEIIQYFKDSITKEKALNRVFEARYDSLVIQSRKLFLEKLNYIHNNPCHERWQLVNNPENYKHSSASNYILGRGVYPLTIVDVN